MDVTGLLDFYDFHLVVLGVVKPIGERSGPESWPPRILGNHAVLGDAGKALATQCSRRLLRES